MPLEEVAQRFGDQVAVHLIDGNIVGGLEMSSESVVEENRLGEGREKKSVV